MDFVRSTRPFGWVAVFSVLAARPAAGDVGALLDRLPPGANAIAYVQVESLLNSKLGVAEGWREKLSEAHATGPVILSPDARHVLMASWIEPATLSPVWEVSLLELTKDISIPRIAREEQGFAEELHGKHAAWTPANAYYVQLENHLLGVVCPADRQFAARWAGHGGAGAAGLSPYLRAAAKDVSAGTGYLFALDLGDVVSEKRLRRRLALEEFECLAGQKIDESAVSKVIASIRGLKLSVTVGDAIMGHGTLEFGESTQALASFAKPLLLEALEHGHASIPDLADWTFTAEGNSIVAGGKLSTEGLRQLCSIINPPSPGQVSEGPPPAAKSMDAKSNAPAAADAAATASKRYFQAASKIVDSFGARVRKAGSLTQGATYLARDARSISRLPILNVDPELVKWGSELSARLFEVASALGAGGLQAQAATANVSESYRWEQTQVGGVYGDRLSNPNDAVDARNAARQRRAAAAEERAKALQQAAPVLQQIETSRANIRAAMTQKYKIEF